MADASVMEALATSNDWRIRYVAWLPHEIGSCMEFLKISRSFQDFSSQNNAMIALN